MSSQSILLSTAGFVFISASSKRKKFSTEDQVPKAEIIRCLDIIGSNCSFSVTNRDSNKCKDMLSDSHIANSYKQKAEKMKYTFQFGIARWFRIIILKEMKNLHFLFRFDETTASQIKKKQFDAYATYHSRSFGQTVTGYLGIIFVGRCTTDDL